MNKYIYIVLFVVYSCSSFAYSADSTYIKKESIIKKVIHLFNNYDTTYIEPDLYSWTIMAQNSNFFHRVSYDINFNSKTQPNYSLKFNSKPLYKIGPYFGWNWIFLGYSKAINHIDKNHFSEFNFNVYTNPIGIDILFLKNKGNFRLKKRERSNYQQNNFSGLSTKTQSIHLYYILNHKHFSYPAAFNQSTKQKKKAGSLLLGIRYDYQKFKLNYNEIWSFHQGPKEYTPNLEYITYKDFCITIGYAYNYIISKNLLYSISITPAIGYRKEENRFFANNLNQNNKIKSLALDCIGRTGLVWNTGHYFIGGSFISHLNIYKRSYLSITNSINYLNIYGGFYLGKK